MTTLHVFTSAALNYIPKVRILAQSLREHHPEARFHLALADLADDADFAAESFDSVLRIEDLGIPNWLGWAFCHRLVELATAIKPFALRALLERDLDSKVLFIDPDIVVFSRLDDLLRELDSASLVLTPHLTSPEATLRGTIDNEIAGALQHGIFNLGFAGVRADGTGKAFAQWWGDRCYRFCRDDIRNGLFTDQRWVDLAPALFPGVVVHRGARHNVATWNISTRQVTYDPQDGYRVNGDRLGFYHFTGFDSGAHSLMAGVYGERNPAIRRLIDFYSRSVAEAGRDPLSKRAWAFSAFTDGTPIPAAARLVYRERVDLQEAFPNPFDAGGFLQWWRVQGPREYPEAFGRNGETLERLPTFDGIGPGFAGGGSIPERGHMLPILRQAVTEPDVARGLFRRAGEIWRTEGLRGLLRRTTR